MQELRRFAFKCACAPGERADRVRPEAAAQLLRGLIVDETNRNSALCATCPAKAMVERPRVQSTDEPRRGRRPDPVEGRLDESFATESAPSNPERPSHAVGMRRLIRRAPVFCGGFAVVGGSIVLAGWWLGLPRLTSVVSGLPPMVANSALMAALLGVSLILSASNAPKRSIASRQPGSPQLLMIVPAIGVTGSGNTSPTLPRVKIG